MKRITIALTCFTFAFTTPYIAYADNNNNVSNVGNGTNGGNGGNVTSPNGADYITGGGSPAFVNAASDLPNHFFDNAAANLPGHMPGLNPAPDNTSADNNNTPASAGNSSSNSQNCDNH